jgi:hypothetical protein
MGEGQRAIKDDISVLPFINALYKYLLTLIIIKEEQNWEVRS